MPEADPRSETHPRGGFRNAPLLLTHGFGASRSMWAPNVEALGAGGREVITHDLRGHGDGAAPDDQAAYTHDACVQDMLALLGDRPPAVVCGMSLGGFLSLLFTARHPERVAALVLVDTGPGYRDDEAREAWNGYARAVADRLDAEGLEAYEGGPEFRAATHANGAAPLARAARGMLAQRDDEVMRSLTEIAVPTLIVVGSEDAPFLGSAAFMERRIPDARRVVIEGAGHAANMDDPATFNAAVLDFLA